MFSVSNSSSTELCTAGVWRLKTNVSLKIAALCLADAEICGQVVASP